MSMVGELKYFLGLQIHQIAEGFFISHSTYAMTLLKKFRLDHCKEVKAPLSSPNKISKDEDGEQVDRKVFRGMIRNLLYLIASRPDLSLSVGICARYQTKPKKYHLEAVKRIIRYVKGTVNLGIV